MVPRDIKDNSLEMNVFNFGDFGGNILIGEFIFDTADTLLGVKTVMADQLLGNFSLFDAVVFDPQPLVFVETAIFLTGDSASDTASLDMFTQRFSAVPVPAAVWLFGSGLAALFGFAYRRHG